MRVGIVSDIHGNIHALKAVEKELLRLKVDEVWCLGDIVGYGAFPNECLEWVRKNCSVAILGNHELAVMGFVDLELLNDYAKRALEWTRSVMDDNYFEFLKDLAIQKELECCQLVHDTPAAPGSMEYILTKSDAFRALLRQSRNLCLFGHTHIPKAYRLVSSSVDELSPLEVSLDSGRYLLNPGSVGQPRDGDPRASFGIFDEGKFRVFRVEYPVKLAAREILKVGLPEFLAARLIVGV
ncbi:MAG: metallophosphoesterase [Thermovibrio sp.]|nr:MAG: metallophosphoesterase [Thermovibrio sp.]